MKVPKEIADKVKIYQDGLKAFADVAEWLRKNTDADGVYIDHLFITDNPTGSEQGYGEYCEQHSCGYCEDSFHGKYYHQIEGTDKYLGYDFDC